MNQMTKKYISFLLMALMVWGALFGTASTAYAAEYEKSKT